MPLHGNHLRLALAVFLFLLKEKQWCWCGRVQFVVGIAWTSAQHGFQDVCDLLSAWGAIYAWFVFVAASESAIHRTIYSMWFVPDKHHKTGILGACTTPPPRIHNRFRSLAVCLCAAHQRRAININLGETINTISGNNKLYSPHPLKGVSIKIVNSL